MDLQNILTPLQSITLVDVKNIAMLALNAITEHIYISLFVYFIPALIAIKCRKFFKFFILSLLFNWTIIGWIILLSKTMNCDEDDGTITKEEAQAIYFKAMYDEYHI